MHIIMQIQYTKKINPGRFELGEHWVSRICLFFQEMVPNLRANFELKTSRGGSPHDLYWCETFEVFTDFSNEEISLRDLHFKIVW